MRITLYKKEELKWKRGTCLRARPFTHDSRYLDRFGVSCMWGAVNVQMQVKYSLPLVWKQLRIFSTRPAPIYFIEWSICHMHAMCVWNIGSASHATSLFCFLEFYNPSRATSGRPPTEQRANPKYSSSSVWNWELCTKFCTQSLKRTSNATFKPGTWVQVWTKTV